MRRVLFGIILVLPTDYVTSDNYAGILSSKLSGTIIPASTASDVAEYHRRVLSSDLDAIINSTHDDDDLSDTIQLSEEGRNEGEPALLESGSLDVVNSDETGGHQDDEGCIIIDECAYCSDLKNDASDQCQTTGRRERIECTLNSTGE